MASQWLKDLALEKFDLSSLGTNVVVDILCCCATGKYNLCRGLGVSDE